MAEYSYTAITPTGVKIEGKKETGSKDQLLKFLTSKNLTVVTIREDFGLSWKSLTSTEIGGLGMAEKVLIAKQLATMIAAGIPIIQAIGILGSQAAKKNTKKKFEEVYRKIEAGSPLSQAFRSAGGIFNEIQLNLISAGEKSGNLNEMLNKVAEDMDKSKQLKGKIMGAMIYPIIIFIVLIAVVVVMIAFMVPQITSLYDSVDPGKQLPMITRLLVSISDVMGKPLFIIGTVTFVGGTIFGYKYYVSDRQRRIGVDKMKLKIPVFGNLTRKVQLTEFCRLTSMLITSGIPIIEAITIVSNAMSSSLYEAILFSAKEEIKKGTPLSLAIAKYNQKEAFPEILLRIIATGEESGKIDQVLNDMNEFYEAEVDQITSNLTKLMEPFILVVVGLLVAFLAVAIYLPIYSIGDSI